MLVKSEITRLKAAKDFIRNPYAWPGAYPLALITSDGGCICGECAKDNWRLICQESFDNTSCGWRVSGVGVNWENSDLYCDHCGKQIESAYSNENL